MRRLTVALLACAALTGVTLRAADDKKAAAIKEELKKLEGTWEPVSQVIDGKETPASEFKGVRVTVKGNRITVTGPGQEPSEAICKIDPTAKPKTIDITPSTGENKGKTSVAIYELKGDEYRACGAPLGKDRPTEFSSKEGSGHRLGVWRRVKADKEAGTDDLKALQGEWRTVSFLDDRKEIDADEFKDLVHVLDGERLLFRVKGETLSEAALKLDPAGSPKAFDLTYVSGAARGVTRKGIYKIEGDRLTLCYAPLNGERPREFTAPAKSGRQVTVLRRITDADKARDPEALAKKLLTQCLRLREDDLVQINGGPSDEALLEALAVQARRQGAHPLVTLATTRLSRRFYDDVPEKFDAQKALFAVKLAEITTAQVGIESVDYETLNAGIPAKRVQARAEANKLAFETLVKRSVRSLWLGNGLFPTAARARALGVTRDELADLFWGGIAVDYDQMQKTGARLRERFEAGKEMHLTHPNGTDLRLRIEKRPVFVSDGVISADKEKRGGLACWAFLPAGECFVTPAPGSAEGRVVIESMPFEGKHVKGLTLTFQGGKLTDMKAESGLERLRKLYEAATGTGKDGLAQIDLGFNPKVSVKPGGKMFAWMAAGAVAVGVGGNDLLGGENTTPFGFTGQVIGGTLEIDGKAVVKDGKLMP